MIAALPMYDWPVMRPWNDRLWRLIRDAMRNDGFDAPDELERGLAYDQVPLRTDLLMGQTCGLPFNTVLNGQVKYLATPCYRTRGCAGGAYSSAIVVRRRNRETTLSELGQMRLAINGPDSWSGYVVLKRHAATQRVKLGAPHIISGGHLNSLIAVADGKADYAAVDAVALGLARRHMPELTASLAIAEWTERAPATPFITSLGTPEPVRQAILRAFHSVLAMPEAARVREALLLTRLQELPEHAYRSMEPLQAA
jgi:ABC-type phosphate/phosphonate transport system substrate-binding protein